MSTFLALLPILAPILTFLVGWLIPSPAQKAAQAAGKVQDVEKKLDAGDPSAADKLP